MLRNTQRIHVEPSKFYTPKGSFKIVNIYESVLQDPLPLPKSVGYYKTIKC